MIVLGIDTSTDAASVAIYDSDADVMLAHSFEEIRRGHAEILFARIQSACATANITLKEVERFAVTTGPGTFTGIRVGLASARGLALAAQKSVLGIGTLEVIAAGLEAFSETDCIVAMDARRDEVYFEVFTQGTGQGGPQAASYAAAAEYVRRAATSPPVVVGSGAARLCAELDATGWPASQGSAPFLPDAAILARLAARRTIEQNAPGPSAVYLRAPDAKLPGAPKWTS